ncbi:MAG: alpha/beta fold hydrolase [Bacteroidota bacterium]
MSDLPSRPLYLVLPGINDSGPDHWQTAWERGLVGARRVLAPDWDRPVCAEWVASLEHAVSRSGPDVVLIAHSLGCLQVVHWARRTRLVVRGAFLVAPPNPDGDSFPEEATGFAPLPMARLAFASTLVASADDPFAGADFSRRCAAAWGSRLIDIGPRGHVNAASGLGDWPEGRPLLDDLSPSALR